MQSVLQVRLGRRELMELQVLLEQLVPWEPQVRPVPMEQSAQRAP